MADPKHALGDLLSIRIEPSSEELEVKHYVLTKPLSRPRTTWRSIAALLLGYAAVCSLGTWGISAALPAAWWRTVAILMLWLFGACLIARRLCIKLVECYQHYAPETLRRRCLCMPTCSEYALLVLKKRCLPVALIKIRRRLFNTCRNGDYQKDFP
ncbi:MAG: membrane protein insertion efficiency factor YidD [Clostridia bacterium]|nr:membrane protein insertion efficiency factor YidD [Clostridia bacterium]